MWIHCENKVKTLADFPAGAIGFIYKITNITNGKVYYGRKTCCGLRKKKLTKKDKLLPENKRKKFKYVMAEYKGWQDYTGSSEYLNEDIKQGDKIKKEIVRFCYNKTQLTYYELEAIICNDGLLDPNCYNGNIGGKLFPKQLTKDV